MGRSAWPHGIGSRGPATRAVERVTGTARLPTVAGMELNDRALSDLLDLDDDLGVLTITMGVSRPGEEGEAARIWFKNRMKELRASASPEVREALDDRLDQHSGHLDTMVDPRSGGQGRAMVVGLGSGDAYTFTLQTPFEHRAVLRQRPYLRPLVAALDEGRAAGVVVATKSGARVLEWTAGGTRALSEHDFEMTDEQTARASSGPSGSSGGRGAQAVNHKDAYGDRVDANRDRFLKEVAEVVVAHGRERSWDRIVVAGSSRIRDRVAELVDNDEVTVHDVDEYWADHSVGQIGAALWPVLRSTHAEREQALTGRMREVALSGGPAALGLRRVAAAVNLGRIQHLAFSHDADASGYVAADGTLHAEVAGQVAQAGTELSEVTHFVERIVERVLATGGRVTRLDDDDAVRDLAAYQGVGALLRW